MCAFSLRAACLLLLAIPCLALAEGEALVPASPGPGIGVAGPPPERGLQARVPLAPSEERLYKPCPTEATAPPPVEAVEADQRNLSDHLLLHLRPTSLSSPNEAGRRHGYGGVTLRVPLNSAMDLRTGVRVDYDSSPVREDFAAEATPTIGVGVKF